MRPRAVVGHNRRKLLLLLLSCFEPLPCPVLSCTEPFYGACFTATSCCEASVVGDRCWYELADGSAYLCDGTDCTCAVERLIRDGCPDTADTALDPC